MQCERHKALHMSVFDGLTSSRRSRCCVNFALYQTCIPLTSLPVSKKVIGHFTQTAHAHLVFRVSPKK